MHSPDFQQQLGQLVLNAGFLESSIRSAILTLFKPNSKQASLLLMPQTSMSNKIEILRRVVISEVNESNQKDWIDLIKDITELFQFRNQIFHSMPGVKDNEIYFFSIKKGKNGLTDELKEKSINKSELKEKNKILYERHRQIMDFIEDYGKPIDKYISSQHTYPILIGKNEI